MRFQGGGEEYGGPGGKERSREVLRSSRWNVGSVLIEAALHLASST